MLSLGLMSGTSLDGIDVAFIKSDGRSVKRCYKSFHLPYNEQEIKKLSQGLSAAKTQGRPTKNNHFINQLEEMITVRHKDAVLAALKLNNLKAGDIDIIGFHGQTLLHGPHQGWSWQIGSGQMLSNMLNITVVDDFRSNDMKYGGQGAPLAPIYHHALLADKNRQYPVAFINIGGVSNMTWIGSDKEHELIAFDTGPGNALLDDWIRKKSDQPYDKDGVISTKGTVNYTILEGWLKDDFFNAPPPKSLDRNQFDVSDMEPLSLEDGAATLCAFTAATIKMGQDLCPTAANEYYICGGGVHNPTIMKMLGEQLSGQVHCVDIFGCDSDFIEAEAFAFMAIRKYYDLAITFPKTTAVNKPSPGGIINNPNV